MSLGPYKTKRWKQLRLSVIAKQPCCVICEEKGRTKAATVVDHIIAHKGSDALMWDVRNLRAVCKTCHDRKTAAVDNPSAYGRWKRIPDMPAPPSMPVTIVCGPPASGKSTYIDYNCRPDAIVIDVDEIASELSGLPMHQVPMTDWMTPTMLERNRQLMGLHRSRAPEAWLIVGAPRLKDRQQWKAALHANVVVMETDADICIDRITHSPRIDKRSAKDAARQWWKHYTPDFMGDKVVRCTDARQLA